MKGPAPSWKSLKLRHYFSTEDLGFQKMTTFLLLGKQPLYTAGGWSLIVKEPEF